MRTYVLEKQRVVDLHILAPVLMGLAGGLDDVTRQRIKGPRVWD